MPAADLPAADLPPAGEPPPLRSPHPVPAKLIRVARAILSSLFLAIVAEMALGLLYLLNLYLFPAAPWAAVPAVGLVVALWRYLAGAGRPEAERRERRALLRAAPLPLKAWGWALAAAATGLIALRGLSLALAGAAPGPGGAAGSAPGNLLPGLPEGWSGEASLTLGVLFVTNSLLFAPLIEEATFRGTMQVPIEREYGPWLALPTVAAVFALLHAGRGTPWTYLALALFLSAFAWRAGSIWPGVAVHSAANLWALVPSWPGDPGGWLAAALDRYPAAVAALGALLAAAALHSLGKAARPAAGWEKPGGPGAVPG